MQAAPGSGAWVVPHSAATRALPPTPPPLPTACPPCPPTFQGTVKQKLAGTLRLDDGTRAVDCLCGVKDQPGLEIDSCAPGAYVLIQGKLLAKPAAGDRQQLLIKAQKVGRIGLCGCRSSSLCQPHNASTLRLLLGASPAQFKAVSTFRLAAVESVNWAR